MSGVVWKVEYKDGEFNMGCKWYGMEDCYFYKHFWCDSTVGK